MGRKTTGPLKRKDSGVTKMEGKMKKRKKLNLDLEIEELGKAIIAGQYGILPDFEGDAEAWNPRCELDVPRNDRCKRCNNPHGR